MSLINNKNIEIRWGFNPKIPHLSFTHNSSKKVFSPTNQFKILTMSQEYHNYFIVRLRHRYNISFCSCNLSIIYTKDSSPLNF